MIRRSLQLPKGMGWFKAWRGRQIQLVENSWNHPLFSLAKFIDVFFLFFKMAKNICVSFGFLVAKFST